MDTKDECKIPSSLIQETMLVVINFLLAVIGTFGNFLIIFAVWCTPQLRQRTSNFLLLSLAVADLLVTVVAQPLFTTFMSLKVSVHQCNEIVNFIFVAASALATSCSVFHLAAIGIDRALSAFKPHQHRDIIKKLFKVMLFICWGTAVENSCLYILLPQVGKVAVFCLYFLSCAIVVFSYGAILYKIKSPNTVTSSTANADRAMEKRVTGTVAITFLLFMVCYSPLFGYLANDPDVYSLKLWWVRTLYLANSSMNFIVYSLKIRHFRAAYLRMIKKNLTRIGVINSE